MMPSFNFYMHKGIFFFYPEILGESSRIDERDIG